MTTNSSNVPHAGQTIFVRNRPAVVREVKQAPYRSLQAIHEVQVEYIDNWPHPDSDFLIWELERGARVVASLAMPPVDKKDPDEPDLLRTFLWANQWSAVNKLAATREEDEERLQLISPWQSAVQLEDYQLYPVLKAMLMPRISLLLGDDVGLGKTIEAGLILSELFVRRRIRRVLIICPAALQLQWRDEMREKFHLDFTIVDREATFRLQRELGVDSNPWASYPRIITSMDYLRQRDVLASFMAATNTLSGHLEAFLPWQMLIVDEVHNLAPASYGDNSDRCEMLRSISPSFEHRLFLSATPHNGYTISFTGLLELLDPVRFQQKAHLDQNDHKQIDLTMIRRLKQELNEEGGRDRFAHRTVTGLEVPIQGAEKDLFNALRTYREALYNLLSESGKGKRERHLGVFLIKLLTKRLLSSSYAFARTWWRHVEGLDLQDDAENLEVTEHSVDRAEMTINDDEERALREEDAIKQAGGWLTRYSGRLKNEQQLVGTSLKRLGWDEDTVRMLQAAPETTPLPPDARWDKMEAWINKNLRQGQKLKDTERLIIFTEYKHTLEYLMARLYQAGLTAPQVQCLFGGATSSQREQVKNAFNDPQHPLRILVGTDTVSEGINLQNTCRYVIHQEIPWNPMRLEQRNGRVDRHGQERDVEIFHFKSTDEADLQFMEMVVKKVDQARSDLGSVGQVIDATISQYFVRGNVSDKDLEQRVEEARRGSQENLDMQERDRGGRAQYTKAQQRLDGTRIEMDLSAENLAKLFGQAVLRERGRLKPIENGRAYRLEPPPTWKKLVSETIGRQQGVAVGQPKLVFDPAYFEKEVAPGRIIFKPRVDAELIRLSHPLMQRAIGVLKQRMWDGEGLSRWTVQHYHPGRRGPDLLLLHLLIEVTNEFRETAHQEVIQLGFEIHNYDLLPLEEEYQKQVILLPRSALETSAEIEQDTTHIRELWIAHAQFIREEIARQREANRRKFAQVMRQRYQFESSQEQIIFTGRLRELKLQKQPSHMTALKNEAERQRKKLLQSALWSDVQQEEEQRLREMEWELEYNYIDRMKDLVEKEQERILKNVLPKRYALATIDVQPLTVEYLLCNTGKEHA